jgi:hypothetical protein
VRGGIGIGEEEVSETSATEDSKDAESKGCRNEGLSDKTTEVAR